MIHIIYMAAGNSRRFGSNKLLYMLNGRHLFRYGLESAAAAASVFRNCTLTVISQYKEILAESGEITEFPVEVIYSPLSVNGASFTIKAALKGLLEKQAISSGDKIMFMTADQPRIKPDTLKAVMSAAEKQMPGTDPDNEPEALLLSCKGRPGNPVIFNARLIPELMRLEGDQGGRAVLKGRRLAYTETEDERELADIDTAEDLFR